MPEQTDLNEILNEFLDSTQAEVDEKVTKAMRLFVQCDGVYKGIVLYNTGFKGALTAESLREHFDTLDLLDQLDHAIEEMEYEVYENQPATPART